MRERELKGILGLALRAGQLVPGAEMGLQLIRDNKAGLALVDEAASPNTVKKLMDACRFRGVAAFTLKAGMLGEACGRPGMAAAALRRGNLAGRIEKLCAEGADHEESQNTKTQNAEGEG